VRSEEVSHKVKEDRNVLYAKRKRKDNFILHRKCILKHVIEGKIQGMIEIKGSVGRRRKQLLDDLKETV
jgi:hypothetical protein